VVICIETSGIEVFDPKESRPCTVYLYVSDRRVLCRYLILLGRKLCYCIFLCIQPHTIQGVSQKSWNIYFLKKFI